jgi:hypothetical protein
MTTELEIRKREAAQRAEQIRLDLQGAGVLYAKAIVEEDWKTLNYKSVKAWAEDQFGPDRFTPDRRKEIAEIHVLLGKAGLTTRAISDVTGAGKSTVARDQWKAGVPSGTEASPRQEAARDREAAKRTREDDPVQRTSIPVRKTRIQRRYALEEEKILAAYRQIKDEGKTLGGRELARHLGMGDDDTPVRKGWAERAWQRLSDAGKMPAREVAPRGAGGPVNPSGKTNDQRRRELKNAKGLSELGRLSADINRMCSILKDYDINEYEFGDGADTALLDATGIYDDLVDLGWWLDSALLAFGRWLDDSSIQRRIEKLRNMTGRTDEEKATATVLADRLKRKLERLGG